MMRKEKLSGFWEQLKISLRRRKPRKLLQLSEERLKMALEASNDGLFDWNRENDAIYFSPRYFTMLGYDPG